jgi:hypothetical protein
MKNKKKLKKTDWLLYRENLIAFAKKYPDSISETIDSAYLAGLEKNPKKVKMPHKDF